MEGVTERLELLTRDAERTATIQEYVVAARLLTRLRHYRRDLAAAIERLEPDVPFAWWWEGFWQHAPQHESLRLLDEDFASLKGQLTRLDITLADPMWQHIEETVRKAAQPFRRSSDSRGVELCVPDHEGDWIVRGTGQLVRGTHAELRAAEVTWTALRDVLPPPQPSEDGERMAPGPR